MEEITKELKDIKKTLKKLCAIFNISADELLEIETEQQRKKIVINNSFNNNTGTINFKS